MRIETPAARNTDPSTSHEAADEITQSGKRQTQMDKVIAMVEEDQGLTAAELAKKNKVCRYMTARRLADASDIFVMKGSKTKCSVAGRNAVTWWMK